MESVDDGHRSVAIYVIEKGYRRFVATVKIADKYAVPPISALVIDCRYLYRYPDGGLDAASLLPAGCVTT